MQPSPATEPIIVMGISVEGIENATLVRKVMVVSVIFACFITFNSVMQMAEDSGNSFQRMTGLLMALLVPACGYVGAKRQERNLLGCFWGCNLFSGVCNTMAVVMWFIMVTSFTSDVDSAYERCKQNPKYRETGTAASLSGGGSCSQIEKSYNSIHNETWIIAMTIGLTIFQILLNLMACVWGKRLYDTDVFMTHHPHRRSEPNAPPKHLTLEQC
jgi:hypothetical protein